MREKNRKDRKCSFSLLLSLAGKLTARERATLESWLTCTGFDFRAFEMFLLAAFLVMGSYVKVAVLAG